MFSRFFTPRWEPDLIEEATATVGYATVTLRNLRCERHLKNGKGRFAEEDGHELLTFIAERWKEQQDSPSRMVGGSPWVWHNPLPGVTLELSYASRLSTDYDGIADGGFNHTTLTNDTLEAILNILDQS